MKGKSKKNNLKISIIVPIYNREKYLEKCIDSIIGQDVGFEENIQLILVNDGSTDTTAKICKIYRKLFPKNILYIEKPNGGVSSARNEGIKNVDTKYFGFIDSDDYISGDAISSVINYFDNTSEENVLAVIKVMNFENRKGGHPANEKFDSKIETHDLKNPKSYDVCPRVAPAFLERNMLKNIDLMNQLLYMRIPCILVRLFVSTLYWVYLIREFIIIVDLRTMTI